MTSEKELRIKIKTTGDPGGAKVVDQAIDGIGDTSTRTTAIVTRDQRRMKEAAIDAASTMRAVLDAGGGRTWALPGAGAVPSRGGSGGGGASLPAPAVAPSVAPAVIAPRPVMPSGGGGGGGGGAGGLDQIAPAAEEAADASRRAADGLDGVADSAEKIKVDKLEDAGKAAKEGAEDTANWAEKFVAFDSASDEITEVIDGLKQMREQGKEGGEAQAEGMKKASDAAAALKESVTAAMEAEQAAADAAMEAEEAKTEAKEETTEAAEDGAEAEEGSAVAAVEQVNAVIDALKEKGEAKWEIDDETRAAEEAEAKRLEELAKKQKQLAKDGKEGAEEAGRNWGGAALASAQFFDDAQYGMRAVVGQIPGLVQMFGLGSGVAGVVGIAAVAVNLLNQQFDLFGSSVPEVVEKTVKELHEMTAALARSRNEALENFEEWNKAQQNGLANKRELEEIADKYRRIADSIKAAADARRQMNLATLDESDAELGFQLSEIELKRSKREITDIEAEEQSQNVRRAYVKAQAELSKEEREADFKAREAGIANAGQDLEARMNYIQRMEKIAKDLVPDREYGIMEENVQTSGAALAEQRRKTQEAEDEYEAKVRAARKTVGLMDKQAKVDPRSGAVVWVDTPIDEYPNEWMREKVEEMTKEDTPKVAAARLAEERSRMHHREALDTRNRTKAAREQAGPDLQDAYRMTDHLAGKRREAGGISDARDKDRASLALDRGKATKEDRALKLRVATEENLAQGKLAGMRQGEAETERQKRDHERERQEELQDQKEAKMWADRKAKEDASRKAAQDDATRRRQPAPDFGESQVDRQKADHEEAKRAKRQEEARQRELALEKEKQDRLSDTIPDGDPYKKPADPKAPARPGFPRGTWPPGGPRPRPPEIDRPSPMPQDPPQISTVPFPEAGDDTKAITDPLDDFQKRKAKSGSTLGGGDARLTSLKAATDALKDGGTGPEYQKLIDVLDTIVNTILAGRKEDREGILRARKAAEKNLDRLKKSRN